MEKDPGYQAALSDLGAAMEMVVKQNNAIDIYEDYFPASGERQRVMQHPRSHA